MRQLPAKPLREGTYRYYNGLGLRDVHGMLRPALERHRVDIWKSFSGLGQTDVHGIFADTLLPLVMGTWRSFCG